MRRKILIGAILGLALAAARAAPESAAGMDELRVAYQQERAVVEAARSSQLEALLTAQIDWAAKMLAEKNMAGNVAGSAVARAALEIFGACSNTLAKTGAFSLPAEVRRELRDPVRNLQNEVNAVEATYQEALENLRNAYLPKVEAMVPGAAKTVLSTADRTKRFDTWMGQEPAQTLAADTTSNTPAKPGAAPKAAPAVTLDETIAESGPGTKWFALARWAAACSSVEVCDIPLANRANSGTARTQSQITGVNYSMTYQAIRVLVPSPGIVFRLRPLARHMIPDFMAWPTADNGWTLQVRVRPKKGDLLDPAMEIQVSGPGAERLAMASGAAAAAAAASAAAADSNAAAEAAPPASGPSQIKVRMETTPAGAQVFVNGVAVRVGGETVITPCHVQLAPAAQTIRFVRTGYTPAEVANFTPTEGAVIRRSLVVDPTIVDRSIMISPNSPWKQKGIMVAVGEEVSLEVSGSWSCGSRGESIGPEGYPNDSRFFNYYVSPDDNPRQMQDVNYGALLYRIGRDGEMLPVGKSLKFTAKRAGPLLFDVNEGEKAAHRGDNTGKLSVRVVKKPAP